MESFIYKGIKYSYEVVDGVKKLRKIGLFGDFGFDVDGDVAVEQIVEPNENGELDTLKEVANFLKGYPEGKTLKEVIDEIEPIIDDEVTEEEIADDWENAMNQAEDDTPNGGE